MKAYVLLVDYKDYIRITGASEDECEGPFEVCVLGVFSSIDKAKEAASRTRSCYSIEGVDMDVDMTKYI